MSARRLIAVLAAVLALAACGRKSSETDANAPGVLNFSILSAENQQSSQPLWQPLLDDLHKQTGLTIKPFFATNYTSLIEAMRFNQVQMGWFSAVPSIEAIDRANAEVLGRIVLLDGTPGYNSILIVHKGSGITLDDVLRCGKRYTFGNGDAKSTSGTLAPQYYLFTPLGITPGDCFSIVRSASHQANLGAAANGLVDVATNNSEALVFAARTPEGRAILDKIQVIWRSPLLPESGILVRRDLDPATVAKVRAFFVNYGKATGAEGDHERRVMTALNYRGFAAADDSYLDPVRAMMDSDDLAEAKRTGNPAKIEAARKALAEVQARMAAHGVAGPSAPKP
jgi:phosphonate transport system substrate-binding protein